MVLAHMHFVEAQLISASLSTIKGHLPPSSKIHGTRFLAASIATILPTKVEPVKQIKSNFCAFIFFASSIPPRTTAMASLSKYFSTSFLITREVAGHISVGLIKQQLPAVIAFINGLIVTATGTFQVP